MDKKPHISKAALVDLFMVLNLCYTQCKEQSNVTQACITNTLYLIIDTLLFYVPTCMYVVCIGVDQSPSTPELRYKTL